MALATGASLGPYKIAGHIGAGGMGEVYRAVDTRLDRPVAIKVLPQHLTQNSSALKRFQREAKSLAALSHPNILTIFDVGQEGELAFVVTELLEGETLRCRMKRAPVSCEKAIELITAVIEGLAAAHSKGVIHRDLKPENIFITNDERIKILDFGLAKRLTSDYFETLSELETETRGATAPGIVLGTVPYMSPEQARGEVLDSKSDIFSTGIILYELLTGHLPFEGSNIASIIHKIIDENPPLPSRVKSDLPDWINPIVSRALAKEKEKRYSTAEFLIELKKIQTTAATKEFSAQDLRSITARIRKPQIVIPAVVLFLVLFFVAFWLINRQAKIRWAREEAIPEIERLIETEWPSLTKPYRLAEQAEQYIPDDPKLTELFSKCSLKINLKTDPPGAKIYMKDYGSPESEWKFLGVSNIEKIRVPIGIFRWKIERDGFETVLAAATTFDVGREKALRVPSDLLRVLDPKDKIPKDMVRVLGAETKGGKLQDFYIDRYEVTNRQFKEFVDSGAYKKREYWNHDFIQGEGILTWENAIATFVDQTNRPGPSTWYGGDYPEGQADYPVSGISWYEAEAYADFAGKSLPTTHHWGLARGEATTLIRFPQLGGFAVFAPFSNFGQKGPVKAGSLQGITSYGAYDMAGNVREWCWNQTEKGRAVRGGAWNDTTYMFDVLSQVPPMDRSAKNGFRCAIYRDSKTLPESVFSLVQLESIRDIYKEKPVPDSIFQVYKEQFLYDQAELNTRTESKTENSEGWTHEVISFDAAYSGERILAHLFLPKNVKPPYQTVVYFPGGTVRRRPSSKDIEDYFEFQTFLSFFVKNGRAVLFPVYKGTFERREEALDEFFPDRTKSHAFVEFSIQIVKDFKKCIDYLESRSDINSSKIAYYGLSWGASLGMMIPAVEERVKSSVLVAGGFARFTTRPEVDSLNYVSRVKIPTLMLNGRFDTLLPYEKCIDPAFELLGTPPDQKQLKVYETDHIPPRTEIIKESLAWLDRYLGPVS